MMLKVLLTALWVICGLGLTFSSYLAFVGVPLSPFILGVHFAVLAAAAITIAIDIWRRGK